MDDDSLMPFGKWKGTPLKDVPDEYLFWLYKAGIQPKYGDLEDYIIENLDAIKKNIKEQKK